MQTPIDQAERVVRLAAIDVFNAVKLVFKSLGDRPFLETKNTDEQRVLDYAEQRAEPWSMWNRAENVRTQIDARLTGMSPEKREALGVGTDVIREFAYRVTLEYVGEMLELSRKTGIPVVGSDAFVPPPPPMPEIAGGDPWQDQTGMNPEMTGMLLPPSPPPWTPPTF